MKEKFLRFLKSNFIVWAFLIVAMLIELTGVCVTSGRFLIRRPFIFLSMLGIFSGVLFLIKNQWGRYWCAFSVLLAFFIVDLIFIVVYDMTGTTFDFSMLKLRGDAMAIVESVPINFVFVLVSGISISLYLLLARYFIKKVPAPTRILPRGVLAGIMAAVLAFHGGMAYFENRNVNPADLSYKLYSGSDGSYYDRGIFGNFIGELYKGAFFNKVPLGDVNELENYIYASNTKEKNAKTAKISLYGNDESAIFGAAEGYNVVTILAESLEWFAFMSDFAEAGLDDFFPNGFKADINTLKSLYPNLYKMYESSAVCLNHHAREKTDISENQSIIGNYPTDCLINYDYPENTVPYSLPNILNTLYGVKSNSFHNGDYAFYNRSKLHENALGFESFTAREQMAELPGGKFTDYYADNKERDLDSEMIEACKEKMFPADRRFNTYITTITTHGQYEQRGNLNEHYEKLYASGAVSGHLESQDEEAQAFVHYAAAAMDLDKALGIMFDYLENTDGPNGKKLIDNTLIVMFGDHNVYYQSLGNYVKDIYLEEKNGRNYTDLFRVPLMVRVGNQTEQIKITKFTTTTDIIPTVLDLLGINYFDNLCYGNSIFDAQNESILYSRAYDVFITDKMFFSSLNNIRFKTDDADENYIAEIEQKARTLLDKTSHVNRIFYYDFLSGERAEKYNQNLRELNGK